MRMRVGLRECVSMEQSVGFIRGGRHGCMSKTGSRQAAQKSCPLFRTALLLILFHFPQRRWRHSVMLLKLPVKVTGIGISNFFRNVVDLHVRVQY